MGKATTSVTTTTTTTSTTRKKLTTSKKEIPSTVPSGTVVDQKLPAVDRILGAILALETILGRERLPRKEVVARAHVNKLATERCVLSKLQMEGHIWYNNSTIRMTEKGRHFTNLSSNENTT